MLTLNQPSSLSTTESFCNLELKNKFLEKYKDLQAKMTRAYITGSTTAQSQTHELYTLEGLTGNLVTDQGSREMTIVYHTAASPVVIRARQLAAQCSTLSVISGNDPKPEKWEFLNDLFYMMGYTAIVITTAAPLTTPKFENLGFIALAKYKNRRTNNTITILLKQLELCL